jgi:hypothetical protein
MLMLLHLSVSRPLPPRGEYGPGLRIVRDDVVPAGGRRAAPRPRPARGEVRILRQGADAAPGAEHMLALERDLGAEVPSRLVQQPRDIGLRRPRLVHWGTAMGRGERGRGEVGLHDMVAHELIN